MEGVKGPSPEIQDWYLKSIFPNRLTNILLGLISDMGVSDDRHYDQNIENKIENLGLQECSLKNRSFWKLVISLETSFFNVNMFLM